MNINSYGCCHPAFCEGRLAPDYRPVGAPTSGHWYWDDLRHNAYHPARLRFVPRPSLLLMNALADLRLRHGSWACPGERVALLVDPGAAFAGLQREYFQPVLREGAPGASPLLFPHTTEASSVGLAAIEFEIKGPCLVVRGEPGAAAAWETAGMLRAAGLADCVVVGAVHCPDDALQGPEMEEGWRAHGLPEVDCAVALVHDSGPIMAPDAARLDGRIGRTGACRWLFNRILEACPASSS
jgi:hypothetical protein